MYIGGAEEEVEDVHERGNVKEIDRKTHLYTPTRVGNENKTYRFPPLSPLPPVISLGVGGAEELLPASPRGCATAAIIILVTIIIIIILIFFFK